MPHVSASESQAHTRSSVSSELVNLVPFSASSTSSTTFGDLDLPLMHGTTDPGASSAAEGLSPVNRAVAQLASTTNSQPALPAPPVTRPSFLSQGSAVGMMQDFSFPSIGSPTAVPGGEDMVPFESEYPFGSSDLQFLSPTLSSPKA